MQKAGLINAESGKRNLALASAIPDKGLNYPRQPIHQENLAKKSNLIFILIDSWYYKAFDSVAMPNLYAFSKQCEYYSHHYSGSNGTSMGLFSLFYSLPSTYWDNVLSTHASPVLVDLALQNGYVIKAFPSATLVDPPIDRTIFSSVTNLKTETTGDQSHDRDKQLTIDWTSISQNFRPGVSNEPVFAFLFYDALHAVSRPPDYPGPFQPEWRNARFELLDSDTDPIPFLNLYKNAAHFLDSLVGVVLKDLKTKGLLENSWIIITGDHGQEFNDSKKNYWGHYSNYTKAQLQVPFMLYREGIKARKFTHWTSHYDVVPTLLTDLFKATNPVEEYSFGQHLHESNRDWLLVGNHDSFAIVQPDKITNVYQFRSLEVTDAQLNPLYDSAVDVDLINKIILKANAFRKE